MINLKNLKHIYQSKKGDSVVALNEVNFTFNNKGLYFITGKSGCGKSTLLNLLSGIDKPTSGCVFVDNENMDNFTEYDYDNYRNNYAGIIFQEFNLIENMTIYENIDMPLKLQGKKDNKEAITEALKKVNLDGYESRYPSELSGGQRQRVTIARQLAKGSKVILADEPTGSLDSENGKNVFELLKKLSQDILIIVASHDLEFAETYGDVIIKMIDGQIVDCQYKNNIEADEQGLGFERKKIKFPLAYGLKIALSDIWHTKIRFIVATILCFVALAMLGIFVTISSYSSETALAHTIVNRQDRFYTIGSSHYSEKSGEINNNVSLDPFSQAQIKYLEDNSSSLEYIKRSDIGYSFRVSSGFAKTKAVCNYVAIIDSPSDLNLYGYSLAEGYLPLTNNNVYMTDYFAYAIIKSENYCYIEDGFEDPIASDASVYSLVGKTIAKNLADTEKLEIAGIINTDYMRFISNVDADRDNGNTYEYSDFSYLATIYKTFFVSKEFVSSKRNYINSYQNENDYYEFKVNDEEIDIWSIKHNIEKEFSFAGDKAILFKDSYSETFNDVNLQQNQVVITIDLYNKIFEDDKIYISSNAGEISVSNFPIHIGEKIKLQMFNGATKEEIIEFSELEIAGLYYYDNPASNGDIFLSEADFSNVSSKTLQFNRVDLKTINNYSDLEKLLNNLRNNHFLVDNHYSQSIYAFENSFEVFESVFISFSVALLVFSLIMFGNFVAITIANRKKDIGIIRAVGGTKANIFKMFVIQGFIFAVLVSIFAIVSSVVVSVIINNSFVENMIPGCVLLLYNPINFVIIPLLSLLVMLIATYAPIRKINKKSPVEIIRNN